MTYPHIETTPKGLIVHLSKGAKLPGVFLNELAAKRAAEKYKNKAKLSKKTK